MRNIEPLVFDDEDHRDGILPGRADLDLLRSANEASAVTPKYQEAYRVLGLDPENPVLTYLEDSKSLETPRLLKS